MIPRVPGRGHIGLDKAGDFRQIAPTGSRPQWFGSRARRDWLRALTLFGPQAGKCLTRNPDQSNDSSCRPLLGDLFGFLRFGKTINREQSGETLTAFARRHGVRPNRLARWRDRLRKTRGPARLRFHPVKVRETPVDGVARSAPVVAEGGSGLELVLRGGRRILIGRGFDAALLVDLVRVLESGPC